jgi:hypothetical protein
MNKQGTLAPTELEDLSRRKLLVAGGATIAVTAMSRQAALAAYPALDDVAPPVEGFFLVVPGKDKDQHDDLAGDRIFFISSAWLPFFELTDVLTQAAQSSVVTISGAVSQPAEIAWSKHGLEENDELQFTTTDKMPAPVTGAKTYYVVPKNDNVFQISEISGGSAVKITDTTQAGVHKAFRLNRHAGKKSVVKRLKQKSSSKDWYVLYSDDIKEYIVPNQSSAPVVPLPNPQSNTYLAMSISPAL